MLLQQAKGFKVSHDKGTWPLNESDSAVSSERIAWACRQQRS